MNRIGTSAWPCRFRHSSRDRSTLARAGTQITAAARATLIVGLVVTALGAQSTTATRKPLASVSSYGCVSRWLMFTDLPRLGTIQAFGISNPTSAQTNAWTVLLCAARPHPAYPCGHITPNLGMLRGTPGEILIDLQGPWFAVPGEVFRGVGHVAYAYLPLPNTANLIGGELYCQGVLVDLVRASAAVTAGSRCVLGY